MRALTLGAFVAGAAGHGAMLDPPPRAAYAIKGDVAGSTGTCALGMCFWFSQSCTIGCPKCLGSGQGTCKENSKATLPDIARTHWYDFSKTKPVQACGVNPWCKPGAAPIFDPCGVAGGGGNSAFNGDIAPTGAQLGDKGSALPPLKGAKKTVWKAGSTADISWIVSANHGGGYQYRLCPKDAAPTEECFQKTPMKFAEGENLFIQYCSKSPTYPPYPGFKMVPPGSSPGDPGQQENTTWPSCDEGNRTAIKAVDVSTGTIPEGSTWRMNPIPACRGVSDGALGPPPGKCGNGVGKSPDDFQFPPAGPDLSRPGYLLGGFGAGACYSGVNVACGGDQQKVIDHTFKFNVVDKVVVPDVPPGDYILSYRWDCEQTPQIWSTCADVSITA